MKNIFGKAILNIKNRFFRIIQYGNNKSNNTINKLESLNLYKYTFSYIEKTRWLYVQHTNKIYMIMFKIIIMGEHSAWRIIYGCIVYIFI